MLSETIERLKTGAPDLKKVFGAAEFAAIKESPPLAQLPQAYVIPLAERAQPSERVNAVRQRVDIEIGVVLAIGGSRADERGGTQAVEIKAVRDAVRMALLGWPPTADSDPFEFAGGELLAFRDGVLWWQDAFSTSVYISG